ncbi:tight junction protein ZO-3 [Lates japonicus]|uniref:Tight junction protein ZO-3 n=1 Tax=Lates japonicus TaxID=270547 RepID=A0AAD3M371_LATJO|nr:tight junction protein ZO-3 [Lates japonicus]
MKQGPHWSELHQRKKVFQVVDTMHTWKLGNWLANPRLTGQHRNFNDSGRRINRDRELVLETHWAQEEQKNEKNVRRDSRATCCSSPFRANSRPYEKGVLLREANFKRPIVILGPLNDIAMEKLAREMPDECGGSEMVPRSGGKCLTVIETPDTDKHPLLVSLPLQWRDSNYIQYHRWCCSGPSQPLKGVKAMRAEASTSSPKQSSSGLLDRGDSSEDEEAEGG